MLKVIELARRWPGFELEVSLELGDREIGAILGPSGSGKSSLLRLVAGLERSDSGRVLLDGKELGALPPERRGVGMVFQDYALFPARTVAGNISYGPAMAGVPRSERRRIAKVMADNFGIGRLLDRYPASLSGGERQRVALARTLAASPGLVLLDEPLSSLDEGLRKRLRIEIADGLRRSGAAALHVTHDVEEALAIADKVFLMRNGRIESSGTPEEIYDEPRSAWAASFIGSGVVVPVESIDSIDSRGNALVRCALGAISCLAPERGVESGARYSVFLPSSALSLERVSGDGIVKNETKTTINRFICSIESSFFIGRFRRFVLASDGKDGPVRLELDLPPSQRYAGGERVAVEVPVSRCRLLPGETAGDAARDGL